MAIDLIITDDETRAEKEVFVCSYSAYKEYWQRIAQQLGLEMLTCLGGLFVSQEYVPQLLSELMTLRSWLSSRTGEDDYYTAMIERVDLIEAALMSGLDRSRTISFG